MDKVAFFRIQCPPNRKNREFFKTFEKNYSTTDRFSTRCSKPLPCNDENEAYVQAVKKAKHGNVYVDTSGMASMKNTILEYTVSQIGSERILFGTDTYSAASQRGRIEFSMIGERDKENILFYNSKDLFDL